MPNTTSTPEFSSARTSACAPVIRGRGAGVVGGAVGVVCSVIGLASYLGLAGFIGLRRRATKNPSRQWRSRGARRSERGSAACAPTKYENHAALHVTNHDGPTARRQLDQVMISHSETGVQDASCRGSRSG